MAVFVYEKPRYAIGRVGPQTVQGQMPSIVDADGFKLFESRAIAHYIALKYAPQSGLVPSQSDLAAYSKYHQALNIEIFQFDADASGLAFELVYAGAYGSTTDEARVEKLTAKLDDKLKAYDQILSTQKYLAGDTMTLADVFHLPYGQMVASLGKADGLTKYANVARWWSEVSNLAEWKKVLEAVEKVKAAAAAAAC